MHRSLLPRYSSCVRFSPPVRVLHAFRSNVAFKRRPLNPRPSSSTEASEDISEHPPKRSLPKPGKSIGPTKAPPLSATGLSTSYIHDLREFLVENVRRWTRLETVRVRLITFGVSGEDIHPALNAFANHLKNHDILAQLDYTEEQIRIIKEDLSDPESGVSVDVQLTRLFYEWAANPIGHAILSPLVSHSTLTRISNLFEATNMSQPAKHFDLARAAPRRKIIMHVGPTNSGKTHNALRALAAARTGVYCGPLRMLAFEIWERLNKGRIVPLGHDAEAVGEEDPDTVTDAIVPGEKPAVQKLENPKFARPCNLVTGDDQRIVAEDAPLVSCTVEMLSSSHYDVAVIDEIQLISDAERGGSWTHALLGVNAREVHLCGEESAVPLVKRIIEDVGDEFEVKRYTRLTPLKVAKHSLRGQLSQVQKGDCVVAFSRSQIYRLRDKIEKYTGLRCALAYGKLPPEVRSQQAALFNDPESGYDVLVGSDAVGMGLNLKIKRMIFARTSKWDGFEEKPLTVRHLKQIAGRAGRFGLHGDDASGGSVTALWEDSMPAIRAALAAPVEELKKARYRPPGAQQYVAATSLPPETPLSSIPWLFHYVGKHHPIFALESPQQAEDTTQHIDTVCGDMPIQMRLTLKAMPLRWKDPKLMLSGYSLLRMLRNNLSVRVQPLADQTGITKTLEDVAAASHRELDLQKVQVLLQDLEASHGTLVAYIWMSYRLPVCFPDQDEAAALRDQVQTALEDFLGKLSTSKLRSSEPADFPRSLPFHPRKIQRPKSLRLKRQEHAREE